MVTDGACGLLFCAAWNPEVAIIFGAAARYRRAPIGSSHNDVHPDNLALSAGVVRPHTGFVGSIFLISPRTGHGSLQVLEMLPAFSCISFACAFRVGGDASIFSVGPSRQREADGLALLESHGAPSN
jgi:hypothetical protein